MPLVLLIACLTPENYGRRAAGIFCERLEECYKSSFEQQWEDQASCREQVGSEVEQYYSCLADYCEFDAESARKCLDWGRDVECADLFVDSDPECDRVFVDCEELAATECVVTDLTD